MRKMLMTIGLLITSSFLYTTAIADIQTAPTQTPATPTTAPTPKPIPQYSIKLISPKPDETFQNEAQSITITVAVTPELEPEDKVVAYVDGSVVGEPIHSTSIALPWLERGSHTLQAKIIQPKGRGAETDTITIFQQRKSKLLP